MSQTTSQPTTDVRSTRKRLTEEQRVEIQTALARGEQGKDIAARMGVSAGTVYAQRAKATAAPATASGESALRQRLVAFAIKTLLDHEIPEDEATELKNEVQAEVLRRVTEGI